MHNPIMIYNNNNMCSIIIESLRLHNYHKVLVVRTNMYACSTGGIYFYHVIGVYATPACSAASTTRAYKLYLGSSAPFTLRSERIA